MERSDVEAVLDVQEPGAVRGLADVFPQGEYPFPRNEIGRRWREEIATDGIDCYVVVLDDAVVGFAATRGEEFLHFKIAVEHWGTGLAETAHHAVLEQLRARGVSGACAGRGSPSSPGTVVGDASTRRRAGGPPGNERTPRTHLDLSSYGTRGSSMKPAENLVHSKGTYVLISSERW